MRADRIWVELLGERSELVRRLLTSRIHSLHPGVERQLREDLEELREHVQHYEEVLVPMTWVQSDLLLEAIRYHLPSAKMGMTPNTFEELRTLQALVEKARELPAITWLRDHMSLFSKHPKKGEKTADMLLTGCPPSLLEEIHLLVSRAREKVDAQRLTGCVTCSQWERNKHPHQEGEGRCDHPDRINKDGTRPEAGALSHCPLWERGRL